MFDSFSSFVLFVLILGMLMGAYLSLNLLYFTGAAATLIKKFKGDEEFESTFSWTGGLVYEFGMILSLGIVYATEKLGLASILSDPSPAESEVLTVFACGFGLAISLVVAITKLTTRVFNQEVQFAHWWSMRIVALGPERSTRLRSWF
jgi:hypothetical protein